jgi:hypothetical protein
MRAASVYTPIESGNCFFFFFFTFMKSSTILNSLFFCCCYFCRFAEKHVFINCCYLQHIAGKLSSDQYRFNQVRHSLLKNVSFSTSQ